MTSWAILRHIFMTVHLTTMRLSSKSSRWRGRWVCAIPRVMCRVRRRRESDADRPKQSVMSFLAQETLQLVFAAGRCRYMVLESLS